MKTWLGYDMLPRPHSQSVAFRRLKCRSFWVQRASLWSHKCISISYLGLEPASRPTMIYCVALRAPFGPSLWHAYITCWCEEQCLWCRVSSQLRAVVGPAVPTGPFSFRILSPTYPHTRITQTGKASVSCSSQSTPAEVSHSADQCGQEETFVLGLLRSPVYSRQASQDHVWIFNI